MNCLFGAPDFVMADPAFASVVFSGGAWLPDQPLSNLLREKYAYVARSVDLALQSTQFWIDLGAVRDIRCIFFPKTNGTTQCRYRIRAFNSTAPDAPGAIGDFAIGDSQIEEEPLADTGWSDLYRDIYPLETLYWGHPSLWDGKIAPEDAHLYPMPIVEIFESAVIARHWLIEFDDMANPAGYLELPRIVMSSGWQPPINMSWGASLATEDASIRRDGIGGASYFARRAKRRVFRFTLDFLSNADARTWISDMQQRYGVEKQIFFVWDPADRVNMHRQSALTTMRTISALQAAAFGRNTAPFELEEVVA